MKQERLNNLIIQNKEHTDKLDLKQVANDFVSGEQNRCYLPQNGWVWLGGCGFGLTTLKELAPGLYIYIVYCLDFFFEPIFYLQKYSL